MNPFGVVVSILQAAAGVHALWHAEYRMAVIWLCFSLSGAMLALR